MLPKNLLNWNVLDFKFEKLFIFNNINPDKLINIPIIYNLDRISLINEIPKMGVNRLPNPLESG